MPRTPLGRAKRSVVVSVRMTEDEAQELAEVFGTKEKGLLALQQAWKRNRDEARR